MNGLAVDPKIIADDTVLDVIFAADFGDEVSMICDSASRAGLPADVLFNKSLDLKIRFRTPTADDFFNGTAYWEDE